MLWGHAGDGPVTMAIFTPMREILRDIRERTGADMELLRGQNVLRPESIEVAEASQVEESVPIKISVDEKNIGIPFGASRIFARKLAAVFCRYKTSSLI